MPVCSIVQTITRGAVDDLMHYCTMPKAECNSASDRPRYQGVIVWLYYKRACNNCFITQSLWWNTEQRFLNGVAEDDAVLLQNKMSQCMRFPTIWYVRPAKAQTSLRIRADWSEPLLVAWVFYDCWATDWTLFGVSKLNRRLHRLVWVYTCQNV